MPQGLSNIIANVMTGLQDQGATSAVSREAPGGNAFQALVNAATLRQGSDTAFNLTEQDLPQEALVQITRQFGDEFLQAILDQLQLPGQPSTALGDGQQPVAVNQDTPLDSGDELPPGGNLLPLFTAIVKVVNNSVGSDNSALTLPVALDVGTQATQTASLPENSPPLSERLVLQQFYTQHVAKAGTPAAEGQLPLPDQPSELNTLLPHTSLPPQSTAPTALTQLNQGLPQQLAGTHPVIRMEMPVSHPGWGAEISGQVKWLAQNNIGGAEIRLNPPELGPIEVRIKTDGDQTSVFFTAHHAATRDALEQALPRLREAFAAGGLQLADANVSEQDLSGRQPKGSDGVAAPMAIGKTETMDNVAATTVITSGNSMIDFYI